MTEPIKPDVVSTQEVLETEKIHQENSDIPWFKTTGVAMHKILEEARKKEKELREARNKQKDLPKETELVDIKSLPVYPEPSRKKVGSYILGIRAVDVYWERGGDGSFYGAGSGKDNTVGEINIGIDLPWFQLLGVVLHEALEMALNDMCCRWRPSNRYSEDNACYLFTMTHDQFSEAVARVGSFLADCLPDLATAHKKYAKEEKDV
jgi:hypothetical protein